MTWTLRVEERARKEIRRLSSVDRGRVLRFMRERVLSLDNPRRLGKPLKGGLEPFWRYRVGNIRIIARIDDGALIILVVAVAHRREIYR